MPSRNDRTSSSPVTVGATSDARYSALRGLIEEITSASAAALFGVVHDAVGRVMPASSFTLATERGPASIAPVYHAGDGDVTHVDPRELARLAAGSTVTRLLPGGGGSVLISPIVMGGALRGWIATAREDGGAYDEADEAYLVAAGRLVGLALARGQAVAGADDEDARVEELTHELTASLELAAVVDRIAERVHNLLREPVVLWVVEGERSRAVARAGGAAVRLGEEQLLRPELLDPLRPPVAGQGAAAVDRLVVPLALGTRTVGFLEVGPWTGEAPGASHLRVIQRLAPPMASAIENARLHDEVRRLSLTDPLVQLPNRRQLDMYMAKECAAAMRGRPLTMILFDLDRFKLYNDTHGHLAGDKALIRFAGVLRSETRAMNLAVRFGGEEFATVLSGSSADGGRTHAERVRYRVEEIFDSALTVSAGVAAWAPGMETAADLIAAADRALYRAKLEGRNRVSVEEG